MVRKLKIGGIYRRILGYLARGDPAKFIIHNTRLKKANYYKKIKMLENHGYIKKDRVGGLLNIELQPKAIKELGIVSVGAHRVDSIRLHDVWISCPILRRPDNWNYNFVEKILEEKSIEYTRHSPNNWKGMFFDYASVKVRVTPNKILFNPPEVEIPRNDDPEHAKNMIMRFVDGVVPRVENLLRVSLRKPRKVSMTVSSQHIAFVRDLMAKYLVERGISLRVYDSTGALRVIVDRSRGPELEAVNKAYAEEDAERLKDLIHGTVTGEFDYKRTDNSLGRASKLIMHVAENQARFSGDLVEYGQKIAAHGNAIDALGNGIQEFTGLIRELRGEPTLPGHRAWEEFKDRIPETKPRKIRKKRKVQNARDLRWFLGWFEK